LPLQKGQSLQFQLNNSLQKNLFITIKGTGDKTKLNVEDLPKIFENTNPITTDKNLVINIGNRRYNLNESFEIALGCSDGSGPITSIAFTPIFTNSNPNINKLTETSTNQPVVIVAPLSQANKAIDQ